MTKLTDKKRKEWQKWGNEEHIANERMMRRNIRHSNYNTEEKRAKVHEAGERGESYLFSDERRARLIEKFGYTEESINEAREAWIHGYKLGQKQCAKYRAIIEKYKPIFNEAEKIAQEVDVSDIVDGFPCGSAHLYLQNYAEVEDLYKALGFFNGDSSEPYKRRLPIKTPNHGQCIAYDERICRVVNEFLRSNGIFSSVHSWID